MRISDTRAHLTTQGVMLQCNGVKDLEWEDLMDLVGPEEPRQNEKEEERSNRK
jgi:hypothetical protein